MTTAELIARWRTHRVGLPWHRAMLSGVGDLLADALEASEARAALVETAARAAVAALTESYTCGVCGGLATTTSVDDMLWMRCDAHAGEGVPLAEDGGSALLAVLAEGRILADLMKALESGARP